MCKFFCNFDKFVEYSFACRNERLFHWALSLSSYLAAAYLYLKFEYQVHIFCIRDIRVCVWFFDRFYPSHKFFIRPLPLFLSHSLYYSTTMYFILYCISVFSSITHIHTPENGRMQVYSSCHFSLRISCHIFQLWCIMYGRFVAHIPNNLLSSCSLCVIR